MEENPSDSVRLHELKFLSRKNQLYLIKFAARPDEKRFQLTHIPSSTRPRRQTFIVRIGDTTADGQLKIEKFAELEKLNQAGILVDASELHVTFTETGEKVILARNVIERIPIYFAEFRSEDSSGTSFYVKEGDSFEIPGHSDKWTLKKVNENSCTISRKTEEGKEITKDLTKSD